MSTYRTAARTAALVLGILLSVSANATLFNLEAILDGAQANAGAGTGSTATGTAQVTFDDITNLLSWEISWSGLLGNVTIAHFHGPATQGVNAGVQQLIGNPPGNPAIGSATINNGQANQLLTERWYINIHSDRDPGGEIRGQVLRAVSEPTVALMLLTGLVGLGLTRRRKS